MNARLPFVRTGPRVALVLGSGGVRSVAAIGICKALARAGMRPDLIVGCSSGALFGATIAMGMEPDEALAAAVDLWSAELTQQRRWRAYPQLVAPRLAGFDENFALRDNRLIVERLERAFGQRQLEELAVPLRVACTDAGTGAQVVLATGPLTQALLASMALPFIFPSVEVQGRRLIDGVISDPLPVSLAGDADLVIALGFEGAMPRRADRPSRLAAQATTALINNLMHARVAAARASGQRIVDIALQLERHVGLWETAALPYLCEAGERALESRLDEIHAMVLGAAPADADIRRIAGQRDFTVVTGGTTH